MTVPPTTPAIELHEVTFRFGERPVLSDVSLTVEPGEIVGILGPNGSGKTTLTRIVRGLLDPMAGEVRVLGRRPGDWRDRELARRLAYVPQRDEQIFPFTVAETVLMGRAPFTGRLGYERPEDRDIAAAALRDLDLWDLRNRVLTELSGGERQRAIVARALAQTPALMLLDEPTSALDIRHQVEVLSLVRRRSRDLGATVFVILHDINLASLFCDRVVLLREGRVAADGPTAEVLTYANITAVFETEVYVGVNELNGRVFMVPMDAAE